MKFKVIDQNDTIVYKHLTRIQANVQIHALFSTLLQRMMHTDLSEPEKKHKEFVVICNEYGQNVTRKKKPAKIEGVFFSSFTENKNRTDKTEKSAHRLRGPQMINDCVVFFFGGLRFYIIAILIGMLKMERTQIPI